MNKFSEQVKDRNSAEFAATGSFPSAYVITFGCQQNEADAEKIRGMACEMGYVITEKPDDADLIVVNTCAVREHAEQKALSTIGCFKHIKAKNPNLLIGVCGCMVAQEKRVTELKNQYPYVDFTFEPSGLNKFPEIVFSLLQNRKRIFEYGLGPVPISEEMPSLHESKIKSWVSIMYGCNNFCSYCIVPYVRDRERSREYGFIEKEVKELVESGSREITLLGQNVNSYKGGCTFAQLIEKLSLTDGDFILRFMTSHPKDVSDELISAIAKSKVAAKHFHLPIQSGSDRILKVMNRHYDREHYLGIIEKLRAAIPDITITTDIIVGFPGETDEDFEQTLDILSKVKFDMIYSFIYSRRKGTPAAEMGNQISSEVKNERMKRLLDLQCAISLEKNRELVGKVMRVLVEGTSKTNKDVYVGRTSGNKIVHFAAAPENIGRFCNVKIERAEAFAMYGKII